MALISWSIGITLVVTNVWIVYSSILLQIDSWSAGPVKDFVYHRKSQISLKDCAKECSKRQSCTGLGYRRRYLLCELYFGSVLQTESPSLKDPCVFIRRDQIKTEQLIGDCYDKMTGQCYEIDCMPFAVENGVIHGNMNHVGARKVVQCNEGYNQTAGNSSAVCQADGTWDNIPVCKADQAGIFERCNTDGKLIECEDQNANCRNNCVQEPVCICSDKHYLSLSGNCSTYDCSQSESLKIQIALNFTISIRYSEKVDRKEARERCRNDHGGDLVKVDSVEKLEHIRSILRACSKYGNNDYWIDGTKSQSIEWYFSDGSAMPTWTGFWHTAYAQNQNCVRLKRGNAYVLNDIWCTYRCGYICEY